LFRLNIPLYLPQQKTSSLKTYFDEIEETNGDNEWKAWLEKALTLQTEIVAFVADRRNGGQAEEIVGYFKGSFNFSIRIRFSDAGLDGHYSISKTRTHSI
jgi:hypothetical protein